jgi:hypothetical protein
MPSPREFVFGPWRAVSVLGVTQILSWGALFYPPVLTVPLIATDHGWSRSFAMAGFSVALFVGGLCSRYIGGAIDRLGGHVVMPVGSLLGAIGLVSLVSAPGAASYFVAWVTLAQQWRPPFMIQLSPRSAASSVPRRGRQSRR